MKRGFTLVELLVVLGVLAMLVAITVPVTTRGFALARRSLCASNLRQLSTMIATTVQNKWNQHGVNAQTPFLDKDYWPGMVAAEVDVAMSGVFMCPETASASSSGHPNIMYRSGIDLSVFVPFNPSEFLCASRRGVDQAGEPYTEYVIEENPGVKSKWSHQDCHGVASWSTNDGIWRVYDRIDEEGMRTVTLVYYDCWWPNELWINGEFVWDNLGAHVGVPLKFKDVGTNYGYNVYLSDAPTVTSDTIVLMDYDYLHVDPDDPAIVDRLSGPEAARHLDMLNDLTVDGAVNTVGPASLYPDLNPDPWTPELD